MANLTASYGFSFEKCMYGGAQPSLIECAALTAAADIYVGDPVKLSGTGDSSGRPSITVCTAGDMVFGYAAGIKATGPDGLNKLYSDSADTVLVLPALPGVVMRVNGGAVSSNGTSLNDIGLRFDHASRS